MKITKKQIEEVRKLFGKGKSAKELSEKFNVSIKIIKYHISKKTRRKAIERARKRYRKLSKKQKKEMSEKGYPKRKEYYFNRYHNDLEFREMIKKKNRDNKKRKHEKAIKEGLCTCCLGKRDSKFKQCSECRKKR